jgi:dihydrofolate synthase/folylpolyglutamate synthase
MNYAQCLSYLERVQNLGIKFGLDNVREILASFGNPHFDCPSVLVAGTNGKGSVCAMITRILTLHGLRAGLFTSPHLVEVEERIRIGQKLIPRNDFCQHLTDLKGRIDELIQSNRLLNPPTYFEHLCCLAFLYFAEQKADMAVLEVGMGGRFDATNVVRPSASVITSIAAEHQKFLGERLSQIAYEKAGIIRPGVPVVCGVRKGAAYRTIKKRAQELNSPFWGVFDQKRDFFQQKTEKGHLFRYGLGGEIYTYTPSLLGEHQGRNAATAIVASHVLSQRWKELKKDKIVYGIETTCWEGRLEVLGEHPLVLLDGAHNEEGAMALREYVKSFLFSPLILVCAFMRDKKVERIADILFPLTEKVILTHFPYFRAATPEEIQARVPRYRDRIICEPDVSKAYKMGLESAGPGGVVLIAGSLFLAGEVKKIRAKE